MSFTICNVTNFCTLIPNDENKNNLTHELIYRAMNSAFQCLDVYRTQQKLEPATHKDKKQNLRKNGSQ